MAARSKLPLEMTGCSGKCQLLKGCPLYDLGWAAP